MSENIEKVSSIAALSFKKGFVAPGMPIVTLNQGENKFNFIVDTGSNENIINKSSLPSIEYTETGSQHSLSGFNSEQQTINACEATFSYDGKEITSEFLIADLDSTFQAMEADHGIVIHGMIGSKCLRNYKFILDFEHLIAYTQQ